MSSFWNADCKRSIAPPEYNWQWSVPPQDFLIPIRHLGSAIQLTEEVSVVHSTYFSFPTQNNYVRKKGDPAIWQHQIAQATSNCTGNRSLPPLVGAGDSRRNRGRWSNVRWLGGLWLVPQVNILVFWWIEGHFAEENNYWYQPWHCVCGRSDYPGKDATLRRFEKFTLDHGGYQAVIISPQSLPPHP